MVRLVYFDFPVSRWGRLVEIPEVWVLGRMVRMGEVDWVLGGVFWGG